MKTSTEGSGLKAATVIVALFLIAPVARGDVEDLSAVRAGTERVPLFTLIPEYPPIARRDRIEGEVQVCFEITRKGRTRRIAVRRSTNRVFEKPAMKAVRASRYEPLPPGADVSGVKTCRTFRFSLEPVVAETQEPQD